MNEAQTRFNKIDPKLRDAGWGIVPGSKILCLDPSGDYIHGRKRWNAEIQITPKQYRLTTVWSGLKTTKIVTLDDVIIITKNEGEE